MNPSQKSSDTKEKKPVPNPPTFVKYIGLSFQLFAIIGAGTWFGWWVQQKSDMKFPVWLLLFSFLSVFVAFYQLWLSMKQDR
ncbi:AtpZ/AtpI family protein [Algoriphagus limi]|uniref:AtpZ/AtpI family protein n=1 Tax=Algoriphagus limi TaxID=2975273 RepID=A0ABT2G7A0_9BACT|nr:AtpZ/AtpI family protein [Algoriphagus limi]MCS5490643.1 AtpZ/AtpI family protein [Algoriphagus limi]